MNFPIFWIINLILCIVYHFFAHLQRTSRRLTTPGSSPGGALPLNAPKHQAAPPSDMTHVTPGRFPPRPPPRGRVSSAMGGGLLEKPFVRFFQRGAKKWQTIQPQAISEGVSGRALRGCGRRRRLRPRRGCRGRRQLQRRRGRRPCRRFRSLRSRSGSR